MVEADDSADVAVQAAVAAAPPDHLSGVAGTDYGEVLHGSEVSFLRAGLRVRITSLKFSQDVTVNRNQWVSVANEDVVREGEGTVVKVLDRTLALFRVEGRCYAIANACPHRGGPLGEGVLEGFVVTCPWHGWAWDLRTGQNVRQPNSKVACFPVNVENGEVLVQLAPLLSLSKCGQP